MNFRIPAYCFTWHINTSPAFRYLLTEPLAPFLNIELLAPPDDAKDISEPPPTEHPAIFCQRVPFRSWLANDRARMVWIPMWDMVDNFPQTWWDALPKKLRVVAFSDGVARRAQNAGLPTLHLRYATDPDNFPQINWHLERTLMYWNRTGLVSPDAVLRLCETLEIQKVVFRSKLDPYIPQAAAYRLPRRMGKASVEIIPDFLPEESYRKLLSQVHVYVAPRAEEGVGMTFLEAMASGCVVVAPNAPTMNEYIQHRETGILLSFDQEANQNNRRLRTFNRPPMLARWRQKVRGSFFRHPITKANIPDDIAQKDVQLISKSARSSLDAMHQIWKLQLAEYAQFILDW